MADPVVNLTPTCGLRGRVDRLAVNEEAVAGDAVPDRDVFAFLGIPYAQPPVGQLRFKAPQPVNLWTGVRDAKQFGAVCAQDFNILASLPIPFVPPAHSSEDCLFLNVCTPTLDSNAKLPVLVWIHGGGFFFGFGDYPDAKVLTTFQDIVVVSINYRLGAFGFLCTGDSEAPGNYGLLDQIEALRFVRQHIARFGGDPDNVTIFGVSAGAVSVSLLSMSPLARGLFQRGICDSGTCLLPEFLLQPDDAGKRLRGFLTKMPGAPPPEASSREVVDYFRSLPTEALVPLAATQRPVHLDPFLPADKSVLELLRSPDAHTDLLIGCNNDEGLSMCAMASIVIPGIVTDKLDADSLRKVIAHQCRDLVGPTGDVERVTQAAYKQYAGDCKTQDDFHRALTEFYGDTMFVSQAVALARVNSRFRKTFVYLFKQPAPFLPALPEWAVVDHGTDMYYVFGSVFDKDFKIKPGLAVTHADCQLSRIMMKYWTNFVKNGNPNGDGLVEWPEYDETSRRHVTLKLPVEQDSHLKQKVFDFWSQLVPQLNV